jgi:hypothetical protein
MCATPLARETSYFAKPSKLQPRSGPSAKSDRAHSLSHLAPLPRIRTRSRGCSRWRAWGTGRRGVWGLRVGERVGARGSERPRLLLQDPSESPARPPSTCQERTPRPPGLPQCLTSPSKPRGGIAGQRPRQAPAPQEARLLQIGPVWHVPWTAASAAALQSGPGQLTQLPGLETQWSVCLIWRWAEWAGILNLGGRCERGSSVSL